MSVLLVYEARKPFPSRWNYDPLVYVGQSLDALETMQECRVASKIANFARELLDSLQKQRNVSNTLSGPETTTEPLDLWSGIPQFNELFPDYIGQFEDYAELGMFDAEFSALDPGAGGSMGNLVGASIVSSHSTGLYPSPAMLRAEIHNMNFYPK